MSKVEIKLPEKLQDVVLETTLVTTRAQKIALGYAPFMEELQIQANALAKLKSGSEEDVAKAKRIRIDIGKICAEAGRRKKEDKEKIIVAQRFIDSLYNTVNGFGRITQGEAEEIEKFFEKQEQERIAKLQSTREEELMKYLTEGQAVPEELGKMPDDVWGFFLQGTKDSYEQRKEAQRKAEEERIKAEHEAKRKAKEEEEKRQAELAEQRKKAEEAEAQRKIEEQKRKAAEEEAKRQAKIAEDKRKAEEEKARQEKKRADKLAAELKAKQEKEAAELQAKKEAEQLAMEEEKRKAEELAKAPLKEKLKLWVEEFDLPEAPTVEDPVSEICERFISFKEWAENQIDKL